jgi:hypothetical protein
MSLLVSVRLRRRQQTLDRALGENQVRLQTMAAGYARYCRVHTNVSAITARSKVSEKLCRLPFVSVVFAMPEPALADAGSKRPHSRAPQTGTKSEKGGVHWTVKESLQLR